MKFLVVFALSALAVIFMAWALSFSRYRKKQPACCAEGACQTHAAGGKLDNTVRENPEKPPGGENQS